jgi:hypothetical protein
LTHVFLTTEELSERYRGTVSVRTLINWRVQQVGPRPTKLGKAVLYRIDDVEAWEARHTMPENTARPTKSCGKSPKRTPA